MTITAVRDAIQAWILAKYPTLTVIDAMPQRNGRRAVKPTKPFLEMGLMTPIVRIGNLDEVTIETDGSTKLKGLRRGTISLTYCGSAAHQAMEDLRGTLERDAIRTAFRAAGISVLSEGPITDRTTALDAEFEERAGFDVIVCFPVETTDTTDYFTAVEIDGSTA